MGDLPAIGYARPVSRESLHIPAQLLNAPICLRVRRRPAMAPKSCSCCTGQKAAGVEGPMC